jgi:lipopolysaccharide transport system ATP-binding protein
MSDPQRRREPAVTIDHVSKRYRLYEKPTYRLLDLFGLCPSGPEFFREHPALNDVSCCIRHGEKVAIIGRNGAGKSTLLKIVTGAVQPTSGRVTIDGRLSPLLQIGAGFHADFTGRQNVYASLAHMGVIGREADRRFDEILDFAELEAFIDQPMKTYSTGMAARLMFSTATAVDPDILLIDELLGVGDAYFSQKSFERMRSMCEAAGATLLLVTHDLYAALNLCERFIWIDQGRIQFEGDGRATVAAYEASVKAQEEERLRRRHQASLATPALPSGLRVSIRSRSGFALSARLALSRVTIEYEDGQQIVNDVAASQNPSWFLAPESNLSGSTIIEDRPCRVITAYGSIYHKVEWAVAIPRSEGLSRLVIDYLYDGADAVEVLMTSDNRDVMLKAELVRGLGWRRATFALSQPISATGAATSGQYGTGAVKMTAVRWLDASGAPIVEAPHGAPLVIEVDYEVIADQPIGEITYVVVFHQSGTTASAYVARDRLVLAGNRGTIRTRIESVSLGSGTWLATVGLGEADLYRQPFLPYFTVNPAWYHFIARGWELKITPTTVIDSWAFSVIDADVSTVSRVEEPATPPATH